jgi:dipeptidyl aminopeptidase/acylaminoacyl peptidase
MTIVSRAAETRGTVPLIPRQVLFGSPERFAPALAPAGDRVAFLAPRNGILNVWIQVLGERTARPLTEDTDRGVPAFVWAPDSRHLLYVRDHNGDERGHLIALDTVTGTTRDLTPFAGVQARLVGADPTAPELLLVGLNLTDPARHDAYTVDLRTGELRLDVRNPGVSSWITGPGPRALGAVLDSTDGVTVLVRDNVDKAADHDKADHADDHDADAWRPCYRVPAEDAPTFHTAGFAPDATALWVLSAAGANTSGLLRIDLATGKTRVVYRDPDHDVHSVSLSPVTRQPDLVVVQREREDVHALDPEVGRDLDRLRSRLSGDVRILGRDRTDRRWLVQDNRDDTPTTFHLFDRDTGGTEFLFDYQPALRRYPLARVEPFSFVARDGLTIHGYLTFPAGRERRALPTVLAVHGGPWTRDIWGLRMESQWLANRGYLSVQVNYRGSTGYGKDFVSAGNRQWGGRMQDDLTDAVRWVIDNGFADPRRIGVHGASYGGYAALVGATFTPELFRCAVAIAAPANLGTFVRSMPGYGRPAAARIVDRVGHPDRDADLLWARSPLSKVDDLRIPLLLVHGANDPRVVRDEPERLVAALRARGIEHEYLVFADEGHTIVRPANRLACYAAVERFLATHLGGRSEGDPVNGAR